jgi:hypothetical protein
MGLRSPHIGSWSLVRSSGTNQATDMKLIPGSNTQSMSIWSSGRRFLKIKRMLSSRKGLRMAQVQG